VGAQDTHTVPGSPKVLRRRINMRSPFTIDRFLEVFEKYNLGIGPMQVILYALRIVAVFLAMDRDCWPLDVFYLYQ
jgi:hypothetical protein